MLGPPRDWPAGCVRLAAPWQLPSFMEERVSNCPPAFQDVFNETRSILEPAGAVAVAGAKAYLQVCAAPHAQALSAASWLCMHEPSLPRA